MASKFLREYNIAVMGMGGVGKTCITTQFVQSHFVEYYDPTDDGSNRKQIVIDGKVCLLDILDTAGQEEYRALQELWIRSAESFLIVYSVTSKGSVEKAKSQYELVQRVKREFEREKREKEGKGVEVGAGGGKVMAVVLAGNKIDLTEQRVVSTEEGKKLADEWGVPFFETSAKTRVNIDEVFQECVRAIWRDNEEREVTEKKAKEEERVNQEKQKLAKRPSWRKKLDALKGLLAG